MVVILLLFQYYLGLFGVFLLLQYRFSPKYLRILHHRALVGLCQLQCGSKVLGSLIKILNDYWKFTFFPIGSSLFLPGLLRCALFHPCLLCWDCSCLGRLMISSSLCPTSCFILRFALHNSTNGDSFPLLGCDAYWICFH